ncbi:MAG: DUF445 family protein [Kiritimatiellia bacterium]
MNLTLQFIIQGAVGFGIGAGTNDLAIRWVFWALLSKKKQPIADAVQKVVSEELMSPDKIASRLSAPDVAESLESSILSALDRFSRCPLPSMDDLSRQYGALRLDILQEQLASLAAGAVADRLSEAEFRTGVLRPFLEEQWNKKALCSSADLLPSQTRELLSGLPARLAETILAPEHRQRLCEVIDSGLRSWIVDYPTPASFLGQANIDELAALAGSRTALLGEELASLLATPPAQNALCEAIRSAVMTRVGSEGVVGSLINGLAETSVVETQLSKFCEGVPDVVRKQFSQKAESVRMRGLIESAVRKLAARSWSELLDLERPEVISKQISSLLASDAVRDMTRHGFATVVASVLEDLQKGRLEDAVSLVASEEDIPAYLDWLAETFQDVFCSSELHPQLEQQIQQVVHRICSRPVGSPERFLPENAKPRLAKLIAEQVTTYLNCNVDELVELTRIWDIISSSIIDYDDKKMESIVRSVANRELRWVTLLGGLIGLLAGISQGILLLILKNY